jgi:hypothetical protein
MGKNLGLEFNSANSDANSYRVIIPEQLRDNNWSAKIGSIQRLIDELEPKNYLIEFDFTKCRWIDPLPLLSMLMEMVSAKKRGFEVKAFFPSSDEGAPEQQRHWVYQNSPNRLLLFLAKEGFFDELLKFNISAQQGGKALDISVINNCKSLSASPSYADAHFIPVQLYEVPQLLGEDEQIGVRDSDFSANTVDNLLSKVGVTLHARCAAPERRYLLYNLRAVLQEFLHNVQEHAYLKETPRLAALYVRYRQGGAISTSVQEKEFYDDCMKQEFVHCSKTGRDWLDARHGCLEVFFLDRGCGIVHHFNSGAIKHELKKVMEATFYEGKSKKKIRRTELGGLHLMYTLMSRSTDYVRVLDDNTWFGSAVPFDRENAKVIEQITIEGDSQRLSAGQGMIGLAYNLRLSWNASTEDGETWLSFTGDEIKKVWDELSKPTESCDDFFGWFSQCTVWDERFNDALPEKNVSKFVLWLPKPNRMKWDILTRLKCLSENIENNCFLIIADIPSREAATYKAAMSNAKFDPREEWPKKFNRIVLATNRWAFAYAKHKTNKSGFHGFSAFSNNDIPNNFKPGIGKIFGEISFRLLVVHWLKWHDSARFWEEVENNNRLYLNEKVVWKEDERHEPIETVEGYLDFPATTHNQLCAALYRNALGRVFGLLDERKTEIIPVDSLANPVVHDVYAHEVYEPPDHGSDQIEKVAIGSVLVSGSTLNAVGLERNIHFFVHGKTTLVNSRTESGKKYSALFHWMPKITDQTGQATQKRIGKTSAIAPNGWLSNEIPRFNAVGDQALGKRNPTNTYRDWQSAGPVIVRLGHWRYEGHHDLVTINIPDAVEDAFARNNSLANFLVTTILPFLGIAQNQLIKRNWQDYPNDISTSGLLVYRSHPSSERILNTLLSILPEEIRREVMLNIFPVLPLRKRFGSSTLLIPPRMREEIRASSSKKKVMIFDDAAISGRTLQDLRSTLLHIGAEEIRIVLIANRLRLPAETGTIEYFWRLDVPTMGHEGNCPLCGALNQTRTFSQHLVKGSSAASTIQAWLRAWDPASPITKWDAGLNPIPLAPDTKKYCHRNNKFLADIHIVRSTGLTIHAAEIHAMTACDDYGLRKIREKTKGDKTKLDAAVKIELAASQLLLFGNELDQDLIIDFVVEGLLIPMGELPDNSPVAVLAVFVVMHTLDILKSHAQLSVAIAASRHIAQLQSVNHGLILTAFLLDQSLLDCNNDTYYPALRLLSTRHSSIAEKLRYLFRETLTAAGIAHSEPIPKLYDLIKKGSKPSPNQLISALNSLASIKDITSELGSELARCVESAADNYNGYPERYKALLFCINEAELILQNENSDLIKIKDSLGEVINKLHSIADCYFHRMDSKQEFGGNSFIKSVENLWGDKEISWDDVWKNKEHISRFIPGIKLSADSGLGADFGGARWIWIPWHKYIVNLIRDLLINVIYRNKPITDPWQGDNSEADMWVHVKFEPREVHISFANGVSDDLDKIFKKIKEGTNEKTRWTSLSELGGSVEIDPDKSKPGKLLVLKVSIPYASHLTAPKNKGDS